MKILVATPDRLPRADAIVLPQFAGEKSPAGGKDRLDARVLRNLCSAANAEGFRAAAGCAFVWRGETGSRAARLVLLGLGERAKAAPAVVREAFGALARAERDRRGRSVEAHLPAGAGPLEEVARAAVEGFLLGLYRFDRLKSSREKTPDPGLLLLAQGRREAAVLRRAAAAAEVASRATTWVRDLVNEPAATVTPPRLAREARALAGGPVRVRVLDFPALVKAGMGCLAGVGQGSAHKPVFIHLTYTPAGPSRRTFAVAGKGICFDSGGLDIKTADGMTTMKDDMAGAAVVLGLFRALRELRPPVTVHGLIAAAENMPSGNSYRPGDVLRALNGKTVEVANTDAEGRLVLADALSYAQRLEADETIDLATLTGAIGIALGPEFTGAFCNDDRLFARFSEAAAAAGEKIWRMPLEDSYFEDYRSAVADMKNSGTRPGGAIKAAVFLKQFAGDRPWLHLDIAGTAFGDRLRGHVTEGATGVMMRTILRHVCGQ